MDNMALLMITEMLASSRRARSRSNRLESTLLAEESQVVQKPETIEFWKNKTMTAFAFVQKENMIAGKVLDFAMQQLELLVELSEEHFT